MIRPLSSEFLSILKIFLPGNTVWQEMFAGSNLIFAIFAFFSTIREKKGPAKDEKTRALKLRLYSQFSFYILIFSMYDTACCVPKFP